MNNPLKYIDPSGQDYIIMEGHGADEDTRDWEGWLRENLDIAPDEKIKVLPDCSKGGAPSVLTRYFQLAHELNEGEYTDIKLIGFSEGAAAVATLLSEMSNDTDFLLPWVAGEIEAAFLLECPTGLSDLAVIGFETEMLYNLYSNLSKAGYDITLADIWNIHSIVHLSGVLPGWEGMSYPYAWRSWSAPFIPVAGIFLDISSAHSSVYGNADVMGTIKSIIHPGPSWVYSADWESAY